MNLTFQEKIQNQELLGIHQLNQEKGKI